MSNSKNKDTMTVLAFIAWDQNGGWTFYGNSDQSKEEIIAAFEADENNVNLRLERMEVEVPIPGGVRLRPDLQNTDVDPDICTFVSDTEKPEPETVICFTCRTDVGECDHE